VRSFPEPGAPLRVSQGGGESPQWSRDGRTVYYWTPDRTGNRTTLAIRSLVAAKIQRGPPFVVTSRDTVLTGWYPEGGGHLHPDGTRLVTARDARTGPDGAPEPLRFTVVTHWFSELRERMGGN
jgi:hypothetical protein